MEQLRGIGLMGIPDSKLLASFIALLRGGRLCFYGRMRGGCTMSRTPEAPPALAPYPLWDLGIPWKRWNLGTLKLECGRRLGRRLGIVNVNARRSRPEAPPTFQLPNLPTLERWNLGTQKFPIRSDQNPDRVYRQVNSIWQEHGNRPLRASGPTHTEAAPPH